MKKEELRDLSLTSPHLSSHLSLLVFLNACFFYDGRRNRYESKLMIHAHTDK